METNNHYKAQEGMTYQRKVEGYIMGNELYLGKFIDGTDDVIENYEEVDCHEEYKGNKDYDNTVKGETNEA